MVHSKFPTVVASEHERAGRQGEGDDAFDVGLEARVQASDPFSSTTTSIPTGDAAALPSRQVNATDAPLVDMALASVRENTDTEASVSPEEELQALRAEVTRLSESVAEIGLASVRVLRARSESILENARATIKARPLKAVACALLAGLLFGSVR